MKEKELRMFRYRDMVNEKGVEFKDFVSDFYRNIGADQFRAREALRAGINDTAGWNKERSRLKKAFLKALGEYPERKVVVKEAGLVLEDSEMTIRKILFSPFCDDWVPAYLYIPKNFRKPLPAILTLSGHGGAGKKNWISLSSYLARSGYVVLSMDYCGQAERRIQYDNGSLLFTTTEHDVLGLKMHLWGYNLMGLMLQETMAAVDVLTSMAEVDKGKIGVTGASGGGTMSFYSAAVDDRIKVSAPAASVSSSKDGVSAADSEQVYFRHIEQGFEYTDIASFLIAPKPLFIVANTQEISSADSTRYVFDGALKFYRLLGEEEKLGIRFWERGHCYEPDQWQEALRWFDRWLKGEIASDTGKSISLPKAKHPSAWDIAGHGMLSNDGYPSPGEVFLNIVNAGKRRPADLRKYVSVLKKEVSGRKKNPSWTDLDRFVIGGIPGKRIMYESEKGIILPAEVLIPEKRTGAVILLDEVERRETPEWQVSCGMRKYLTARPDLRGWGETSPVEEWEDWENWGQNFYAGKRYKLPALAHKVGRSLLIDRVKDVSALMDVLAKEYKVNKFAIWGRRGGALVALFTALTDSRVNDLTLEHMLYSYADVCAHNVPAVQLDGLLYSVLRDGADIKVLLKKGYRGKLSILEPVNGVLAPVPANRITLTERKGR